MASDLLALLDTLDGLHGAATHHLDDPDEALGWVAAGRLIDAYPRLAQALRTALTPTTDGEREAREALASADVRADRLMATDDVSGHVFSSLTLAASVGVDRDHLRTALNLLDAERAKAADAARERAAIVAWLRERAEGRTDDSLHADLDAIERGAHTKVTP